MLPFSVQSCWNEILRGTHSLNYSHLCLQGIMPTKRTEAAFQITWAAKILPTGQKDGQSLGIITEWCLKWSRNISKRSCCSNWDSTGDEHWNVSMFRAIEVGVGMQHFPWSNEFIFPFTVNTLPLSFAISLSCPAVAYHNMLLLCISNTFAKCATSLMLYPHRIIQALFHTPSVSQCECYCRIGKSPPLKVDDRLRGCLVMNYVGH